MGLALYSITYMGTNVIYMFGKFGIIAGYTQAVHSYGAVVLCQYMGTSFSTACAVSTAVTTPLVRPLYRACKSLYSSRNLNDIKD